MNNYESEIYMKEYKTVSGDGVDEIVIDKSRFIGYSFHIDTQEQAENIIKSIKKKHYDATHNCYAYIIGEDMSVMKCSDDGEPGSTAGIPMLEVLKKENITNCLVIATRYFGGIKLGVGGLVRAYTKTAKIALSSNVIVEKKIFETIEITIDYSFVGKIQKFIENKNLISLIPVFSENVKFIIYIEAKNLNSLIQDLKDITNANCTIKEKEKTYLSFVQGEVDMNL